MNTITAAELPPLLRAGATLIHTLPRAHYDREHLPGAIPCCVYEMAFVANIRELIPDLTTPLIVYGSGNASLESETAVEKLVRAGYSQVHHFRGGLAEWTADGRPVEGTGTAETAPDVHGRYSVDVATSVVRWTGRNLFNHHHGTLKLADGHFILDHGVLASARLVLDMNSIACEDLHDPTYNALLIRHLRDDDFFAVDRFPSAVCEITTADPVDGATTGTPNFILAGALTLRGITHPIQFPAVIAAADSDHLTGQAQLEIDRTRFGSYYGSGRLFAFLGPHVVNDQIHLHIKLHATRS